MHHRQIHQQLVEAGLKIAADALGHHDGEIRIQQETLVRGVGERVRRAHETMPEADVEAPGDPDGLVLYVHGRRDVGFGERMDWPRGRWGGWACGGG